MDVSFLNVMIIDIYWWQTMPAVGGAGLSGRLPVEEYSDVLLLLCSAVIPNCVWLTLFWKASLTVWRGKWLCVVEMGHVIAQEEGRVCWWRVTDLLSAQNTADIVVVVEWRAFILIPIGRLTQCLQPDLDGENHVLLIIYGGWPQATLYGHSQERWKEQGVAFNVYWRRYVWPSSNCAGEPQ